MAEIGEAVSITAFGELSWSADGTNWESSNTLGITIENDIYKGTEGTPVGLPTPDAWLEARRPVPLDLEEPPTDGVAGVQARHSIDLEGIEITAAGDVKLLVLGPLGGGGEFFIPVAQYDSGFDVAVKLHDFCWTIPALLVHYTPLYDGSTFSLKVNVPFTRHPLAEMNFILSCYGAESAPAFPPSYHAVTGVTAIPGTVATALGQQAIVTTFNDSGMFRDEWHEVSLNPVSWNPPANIFKDRASGIYYRQSRRRRQRWTIQGSRRGRQRGPRGLRWDRR